MDSDDVNDIDDTEESLQVVDIIENTYYELMTIKEWNHLKIPKPMESLSDSDYPSTLKIPDDVVKIEEDSLRYESRESSSDSLDYKPLKYMSPIDFTKYVLSRTSTDSSIDTLTVKGSTTPLLIKNDAPPSYWTSFDEKYITMDSYDSDIENTVQGNKSLAYCTVIPVFDPTDGDFVPECPTRMFPMLLAEATRACFLYLKQTDSPMDAKRSLRGNSVLKGSDYVAHERKNPAGFGRPR